MAEAKVDPLDASDAGYDKLEGQFQEVWTHACFVVGWERAKDAAEVDEAPLLGFQWAALHGETGIQLSP